MPIYWQQVISPEDVRLNPSLMFIYGDNLKREGRAGQANAMRGEANAHGIITKRLPSMTPAAFFTDDDFDEIAPLMAADFIRPTEWVRQGKWLVIPARGIGTGYAKLNKTSPKLYAFLREQLVLLVREAKSGVAQR